MTRICLTNAVIFDGVSEDLIDRGSVFLEGCRIREVRAGAINSEAEIKIDCGGRFLMPGLIDNHFHAYSATFDIFALDRMPKALLVSHASEASE